MDDQQIENLLNKIVEKMISIKKGDFQEECPIGIIDINNWEWPQGVGMYGLYRYYEYSGDESYLKYLLHWYDRHLQAGLSGRNVNTTAPMLTLACLYERTKNEQYLQLCSDWAEWVTT